jgi:hypothetical protein
MRSRAQYKAWLGYMREAIWMEAASRTAPVLTA